MASATRCPHYNVNAGVPKTLIQHLIRWVIASEGFAAEVLHTLGLILDTEISPELVPPGADAALQSTEQKIGPYALQDFTLFYILRYGFRPSKIAFLALRAWSDAERGSWPPGFPQDRRVAYALPEIKHWLELFLRRYFGFSQFKRSAMPNGPKLSAGGLALAARRLAGAVGRKCPGLARRARPERAVATATAPPRGGGGNRQLAGANRFSSAESLCRRISVRAFGPSAM